VVVVVPDATFGSAVPDMEATTRRAVERVVPLARQGIVPVVTGYIGATPEGVTTTLGRNGSDYSGAILGAAVGAEEIWIWTDVDGVMTADPRLVPSARSLPDLSYAEAAELAYFGSKVIHPRTIVPAVAAGVPIRIKNTFNPDHPSTLIAASSSHAASAVKAVTVIRDLALVTVEGLGMLGVPGIAGRTFGAMATAGVNVLMISQASSESNIAFVVAQREVAAAVAALREAFALELHRHEVDAIRAQEGVAIVTAVGGDMRGTPGVAGRLFGALGTARVNVIAIAQGSSELSISCTVLDSAVVGALRAVHAEFVEGTH
jgi:aspartate kinase